MFDDDAKLPKHAYEIGADLSALSVAELRERVAILKLEIERIEAEVVAKDSTRSAAESIFSQR